MQNEGPLLEVLTRRLAECPADFLAEPRFGNSGVVEVAAVVSDLVRDLGGSHLTPEEAAIFQPKGRPKHRNRLRSVLIASWLLHDSWFLGRRQFAGPAYHFLGESLGEMAGLVQASQWVVDPDRREELVRLCLKSLGLRPAGETLAQAEDRLSMLNSVERDRVLREAEAAEARARQIREAMAAEAALEATATYSPS